MEVFIHELSHVAVGCEHEHDEVFEEAFNRIKTEYENICVEVFGKKPEMPKKITKG